MSAVQRERRSAAAPATPRGLVWSSDDGPGIRRERVGDKFVYRDPAGRRIRLASELKRINSLAIPPAYEKVWICPLPNGHLQATGRDARGRKQYRYHPDWRLARDADKFERMLEFGAALPRIRARVKARAGSAGRQPRRAATRCSRRSSACSTPPRAHRQRRIRAHQRVVRPDHLAQPPCRRDAAAACACAFAARAASSTTSALDDPRVARIVRRCQAMPGQELFQYVDEDGNAHAVGSADVNDYIRESERRRLHRQGLPHLARQRVRAGAVGRAVRRRRDLPAERERLLGDVAGGSATRSRCAGSLCPSAGAGAAGLRPSTTSLAELDRRRRRRAGLSAAESAACSLSCRTGNRVRGACAASRGPRLYLPVGRVFLPPGRGGGRHPWQEPLVLVSQPGGVRTLTLNRPKALNSFTGADAPQLATALEAAAADRDVRCLVLTGSGRGFCAGQDLADPAVAPNLEPGGAPTDVGATVERFYKPLALRVRAMPMPVIAAVNGVAAGAGANLALCCDLVVAARSASFIQAFAKIGLMPDCGGTWLLPRLVGRARALALAMLGDKLAAEDAERIGLIWKCVDDAAFEPEVQALAARLAAMPTRALVAARGARRRAGARLRGGAESRGRRCSARSAPRPTISKVWPRSWPSGRPCSGSVSDGSAMRPPGARPAGDVPPPGAVGEHMFAADRASRGLGMRIVAAGEGTATLTMTVRDDMLNGHEICHGGLITTLADSAFAFACNSRNVVTVASAWRSTFSRRPRAATCSPRRRPKPRAPAARGSTTWSSPTSTARRSRWCAAARTA